MATSNASAPCGAKVPLLTPTSLHRVWYPVDSTVLIGGGWCFFPDKEVLGFDMASIVRADLARVRRCIKGTDIPGNDFYPGDKALLRDSLGRLADKDVWEKFYSQAQARAIWAGQPPYWETIKILLIYPVRRALLHFSGEAPVAEGHRLARAIDRLFRGSMDLFPRESSWEEIRSPYAEGIEIGVPNPVTTSLLAKEARALKRILVRLGLGAEEGKIVPQLRPGTRYPFQGFPSGALASVSLEHGRLSLYLSEFLSRGRERRTEALVHELGHEVRRVYIPGSGVVWKEWRDAFATCTPDQIGGYAPTEYSTTNVEELFAETFMCWVFREKSLSPEALALIKRTARHIAENGGPLITPPKEIPLAAKKISFDPRIELLRETVLGLPPEED